MLGVQIISIIVKLITQKIFMGVNLLFSLSHIICCFHYPIDEIAGALFVVSWSGVPSGAGESESRHVQKNKRLGTKLFANIRII